MLLIISNNISMLHNILLKKGLKIKEQSNSQGQNIEVRICLVRGNEMKYNRNRQKIYLICTIKCECSFPKE